MPFFKNISNSGKHFFMVRSISTILVFSMLCSGCGLFTEALWERTEPDEYVRVGFGEISEEEIKERNLDFIKDDCTSSYFVEKDSLQKFSDYTYRALGTPITIVLDTATIIALIAPISIIDQAYEDAIEKIAQKIGESQKDALEDDIRSLEW
jgi:hypothetical protein